MALPANLLKMTWFFEFLGQGASESYYYVNSNLNIQQNLEAQQGLALKRAKLLAAEGTLIGMRIAEYTDGAGVRVRRKSLIQKLRLTGTQTSGGSALIGEDSPMSLQVTMVHSATGRKKLCYMSYPWAGVVPGNNTFVPSFGGWQAFFEQWANAMIAGGMGWVGQTPIGPFPISNYTVDALTGRVTLTVGAGPIGAPVPAAPGWINGAVTPVTIDWPGKRLPLEGRVNIIPGGPATAITVDPYGLRAYDGVPGKLFLEEPGFFTLNTEPAGLVIANGPVGRQRGKNSLATRGRAPRVIRW